MKVFLYGNEITHDTSRSLCRRSPSSTNKESKSLTTDDWWVSTQEDFWRNTSSLGETDSPVRKGSLSGVAYIFMFPYSGNEVKSFGDFPVESRSWEILQQSRRQCWRSVKEQSDESGRREKENHHDKVSCEGSFVRRPAPSRLTKEPLTGLCE